MQQPKAGVAFCCSVACYFSASSWLGHTSCAILAYNGGLLICLRRALQVVLENNCKTVVAYHDRRCKKAPGVLLLGSIPPVNGHPTVGVGRPSRGPRRLSLNYATTGSGFSISMDLTKKTFRSTIEHHDAQTSGRPPAIKSLTSVVEVQKLILGGSVLMSVSASNLEALYATRCRSRTPWR